MIVKYDFEVKDICTYTWVLRQEYYNDLYIDLFRKIVIKLSLEIWKID